MSFVTINGSTQEPHMNDPSGRLSRRALLSGTVAAASTASITRPALAQDAISGEETQLEDFRTLCTAIVGMDTLPDEPLM